MVFWLFFERKQPMVYFRSSIFKGSNLFHLTERASAIATIIGNALAVSGALGNNKDIETVFGALFTLVNVLLCLHPPLRLQQVLPKRLERKWRGRLEKRRRGRLERRLKSSSFWRVRGHGESR